MRGWKRSIGTAAALLFCAGCSGGDDDTGASPTGTPAPSPTPTETPGPVPTPTPVDFAWIRTNVLDPSCGGMQCHGEGSDAPFLAPGDVVNAPTRKGPFCDGRLRVVPGNLAASTLYQKLRDPPPCGERMPRGRPALPAETLSEIERWIVAGAP